MEYKYIKGFEGEYQIDTKGDVYSLKFGKRRLLKQIKNHKGYLQVILCKDGKVKSFLVHRLVAMAFLPNPDNLPFINHKNEIKDDNRVENLEWCTASYNQNYGTCQKRRVEKLKKKSVNQYTKEGLLIASYPSTREAERQTGDNHSHIYRCCNGGYFDKKRSKWVNITQYNGYIWRFAE